MTLKESYIVRVRFCGGCNPEIDRRALLERLQRLRTPQGSRLCFTTVGSTADVLLKINGCAHACLDEAGCAEIEAPVTLAVQGRALDCRAVPEIDLPAAVFERIQVLTNPSE